MSQRRGRSRGENSTRQRAHSAGGHYARGAGPYPIQLQPVALPGDYVELLPDGATYRVDAFTVLAGVKAFQSGVTVAANDEEADNQPSELEMDDGWLGQFRMANPGQDIPVGVDVKVDQGGQQKPMFTTKNTRGRFDRTVGTEVGHDGSAEQVGDDIMLHFTEVYVFEDEPPYYTFDETAGAQQTVQDVEFRGYKFSVSEASPPDGVQAVPLPVAALE